MANAYYEAGEQRAEKVRDLFAAIARRYDLLNDLQSFGLHRLWKRRVAELAQLKRGDHALDICCGTGDIALALARCGAETVGLDFSKNMLEVAERRRHRAGPGVSNLKFVQGDAQRLPFPDNFFDAVTIGYGLRNLAGWEAGLVEMIRVAKPGGRVVVLDFGKPANRFWRNIYFLHLKCSVPLVGFLFAGNVQAYGYILESLKHYPAQLAVAERMRELKLVEVGVVDLLGGAMAINYGRKTNNTTGGPETAAQLFPPS